MGQIVMFCSATLDSIHVYRSSASSIQDVTEALLSLIDKEKATLISGDFNICLREKPKNILSRQLEERGFTQLNKEPTHIEGGQIDHVYSKDDSNIFKKPHLF